MPETDSNLPSPHPDTQPGYFNEADDEISLKDLILNLWYHRKIIVVLSVSAIFIIAAAAAWVYLRQQNEKVVSLEFRLDFEGADNSEYPNGLKFSTADILSTPVLSEVYAEKDLQRYLGFPEFKAGLSIYQKNDALRFMEYEYAEKLSQKNLSLEERDRLETEFLEKKKTVLVPVYTFTFRYSGRGTTVPEVLIFGVLNDILRILPRARVPVSLCCPDGRRGRVVRQRIANPRTPVRFRAAPPSSFPQSLQHCARSNAPRPLPRRQSTKPHLMRGRATSRRKGGTVLGTVHRG